MAEHLKNEAVTLESFNRVNKNRRSQAYLLHDIRSRVGSLGRILGQLHQIRHEVEPWQQQAIDRISPIAETLAHRTEAASKYVEANHGPLSTPAYREDVYEMSQAASELHKWLGDYLAHAEGQQKLQQLMKSYEQNKH